MPQVKTIARPGDERVGLRSSGRSSLLTQIACLRKWRSAIVVAKVAVFRVASFWTRSTHTVF